jgi:hypothetical protein
MLLKAEYRSATEPIEGTVYQIRRSHFFIDGKRKSTVAIEVKGTYRGREYRARGALSSIICPRE